MEIFSNVLEKFRFRVVGDYVATFEVYNNPIQRSQSSFLVLGCPLDTGLIPSITKLIYLCLTFLFR